jgi:hypothetical protein
MPSAIRRLPAALSPSTVSNLTPASGNTPNSGAIHLAM